MKAIELYNKLESDFIQKDITDRDWASRMPGLSEYLFSGFKKNGGIGLMCDFANEINKVYTTVFLSDKVLSRILQDNISNAMLFSHHPTNWDLRDHGGNYPADEEYIIKLKERKISIYVLHHPLDDFGQYSTCGTLAKELGIYIDKPAFLFCGAMCGIIGITDCKTIDELSNRYSQILGHETSVYLYGDKNIRNQKVAVCPGGSNTKHVVDEMLANNINTLITGLTLINEKTEEVHKYEKREKINLLGGTHYSSEKFAPIKMCNYFNNLGLPSEFIDDEPNPYDL